MGLAQQRQDSIDRWAYEYEQAQKTWSSVEENAQAFKPALVPPRHWSDADRDEFLSAFSKLVPLDVTYEHLAGFCEAHGKLAPEALPSEARGKLLLALMRPEAVAKLVNYARENP